jgi:hypothetical protein
MPAAKVANFERDLMMSVRDELTLFTFAARYPQLSQKLLKRHPNAPL